jgi:hypothetical protein
MRLRKSIAVVGWTLLDATMWVHKFVSGANGAENWRVRTE